MPGLDRVAKARNDWARKNLSPGAYKRYMNASVERRGAEGPKKSSPAKKTAAKKKK